MVTDAKHTYEYYFEELDRYFTPKFIKEFENIVKIEARREERERWNKEIDRVLLDCKEIGNVIDLIEGLEHIRKELSQKDD